MIRTEIQQRFTVDCDWCGRSSTANFDDMSTDVPGARDHARKQGYVFNQWEQDECVRELTLCKKCSETPVSKRDCQHAQ